MTKPTAQPKRNFVVPPVPDLKFPNGRPPVAVTSVPRYRLGFRVTQTGLDCLKALEEQTGLDRHGLLESFLRNAARQSGQASAP
jgi:hypothetical protein